MSRLFITTAIPYVNGQPHIGHALELVQVATLRDWYRGRGQEVRSQTGTDDNALKNVQSAEAAGVPVADYVKQTAMQFADLATALGLTFDDFIATSSDPRHAPGVAKLWQACAARGDFYTKDYTGLYCVGCETFYQPDDLTDGRTCPEHNVKVERISERNWFFKLSAYGDRLAALINSGELEILPATRRREVLSFIESGLEDFSVSRSRERAQNWGIPVPGDDGQVIYVWYDALGNYITAPGYGSADESGFEHWWNDSDQRIHVIGKGIIRFHAVYWPAMLLSAGLMLPTSIFVHEYLTANGKKIGKSTGNNIDPIDLADRFGSDAVRWWMLRDVSRANDTDFTEDRLVGRANEDLANTVGNLVSRTVSMISKYRGGAIPVVGAAEALRRGELAAAQVSEIGEALRDFDFRKASDVIIAAAVEGNRLVDSSEPWKLAKADEAGQLDEVLGILALICRSLGEHLAAFTPNLSARIALAIGGTSVENVGAIFPRL